jgi:methionine synthase / methylenetetrahydrofolate reductase(NADPH)
MKTNLRDALKQSIVVGDGAMGTYLHHLGFPVGICFEELNIEKPEVVEEVHRRYIEAGARLIETNTFSANREKLARYGLEEQVKLINKAGVDIARKAVAESGNEVYVVASVGSIRSGKRAAAEPELLTEVYREQLEVLLGTPIDGIMLESYLELEELFIPLRLIRERSDIPVICQLAADDVGRTLDGHSISEAFRRLRAEGADVVGFNCRSGPYAILRAMEKMDSETDAVYSVFPNAGLPDYVDGQFTYTASPEYFAQNAVRFADFGARLIGGCCGTTPEHVRAISQAISAYQPSQDAGQAKSKPTASITAMEERKFSPTVPDAPARRPSIVDLAKERVTVVVELDPPRGLSTQKFMEGCEALQKVGADAITMADNPKAVTRMSNVPLGYMAQQQYGVRPLLHIACRDRNLIGMQSHLMGLHALGIDHLLAITGDPVSNGDLPQAKSVFDLTSTEVIRMIKQLNEGIAFSGQPLKNKANFIVGGALPNFKHIERGVLRLEKKIEAGADYIMTQCVYDHGQIEKLAECTKHLDVPIFVGIMPLANGRNAEFLHNEMPGISVPDEIRKRMAGLEGEAGRREGMEIAKELLDTTMKHFKGIYLVTPFLSYEVTVELSKYVWEKAGRALTV